MSELRVTEGRPSLYRPVWYDLEMILCDGVDGWFLEDGLGVDVSHNFAAQAWYWIDGEYPLERLEIPAEFLE